MLPERVLRADEGCHEHDREEDDREHLREDPHRPEHEPTERTAEISAGRAGFELRRLPERAEGDE